ncbi:alpha-2-macroglobulin family protein [Peteryoungia algae]|uniref:Alpha-2-macroglobulin family protein n=1 Tax=Peteryoungia algae TaxID=2919917 RepID=A0ABT0D4Y8_9HYPH|nr:alpha-2-macroglobulin family protein [Rhizobium sp. SSM4.3]MCJ8240477.1 alpha-2-macroglobulin family protein [Rhizobium sp. SSM4.3]
MFKNRFSALLTFALALVPLSPPVSAQDLRTIERVDDADYFGFDLRTEKNVSLDECEASCIGDAACRAFTFNPKVNWCFLKTDYDQLNSFPGAIAGRIVLQTAEPDIGAPPALTFVSEYLKSEARNQRDRLAIAPEQDGWGRDALIGSARAAFTSGNIDFAIVSMKGALSMDANDPALWLEMARMANTVANNYGMANEGAMAAINGYLLTRGSASRAEALATLAKSLENSENWRPALSAYKASLELASNEEVGAALKDLRSRQGFRVVSNTVDSDSASPRACVEFSEPLVKRGVDYTSFVTLDGKTPKALEAKNNQVCVEGLEHGGRYRLALRAGLPSSVDENLEAPVELEVYVRDRSSSVRFTGDSFVLPSSARQGIPLVSVNADSANLELYRIGDRNIAPLLAASQFLTQMDGYTAGRVKDEIGELVWQGSLDIANEQNREVVTSIPLQEALPTRKPGIYVLTAVSPTSVTENWDSRATQWFVISDIGLSTFAGTDGLHVFARSLASASPLANIELQLIAKNNEILATATTDAEGRARFDAGLVRGGAALAPAVIAARSGADDNVFLDMTRAGFDLSDRGVTGRPAPGPVDILAWTERGIYRPGETVHVAALARDTNADAISGLPLTFLFSRPDGVEFRRMAVTSETLGGYSVDLPILANAMRGTWTVAIHTDPKKSAIAQSTFLVDDFVPDRLDLKLSSEAEAISPEEPVTVSADGRYLYGAPAAGLTLEGEVVIRPTTSHPDFPRYSFGLADEEGIEDVRLPLEGLGVLDDDGLATIDVSLTDLPSTTRLLNADVALRLREGGGRAVERKLTMPVTPDGPVIGIKAEFEGDLAENSNAAFNLIALGPDGERQALPAARWKLIKLERNYQWYRDGSSWRYEPITTTKLLADGMIDIVAEGTPLSVPVTWGSHRLEVEQGDAVTSVDFDAGWFVTVGSTETPDALEIGLDKASYQVGDTAKLRISPRFAGQVIVTSGTDALVSTQVAEVLATGTEIEIPVSADFGAGVYVSATLFRPGDAEESRMPARAIGIAWLAVDPGADKLAIKLSPPERTLPRQPLEIPVEVAGAGVGDEAYVMVAAVDVGILNLTRYETPDPETHYFGQRRLGLELRDLYGRLIDGSLGATGRLRTGGDGGQVALQGNPPREKLVAFFSGPVKLDPDGKATISFDIPQFNGTARVMAWAWSKTGVGHSEADVIIRDPVVVTASLPKFLAPNDESNLRLDIAATDAPSGTYTLAVTGNDPVSIGGAESQQIELTSGETTTVTLPLTANAPGDGTIDIALTGADGIAVSQSLDLPVRPSTLPITERQVIALAPGKSLTVDGDLLADSLLQGASVSLNVARADGLDIPSLLMALDRYPYGCAEQTTSRALPLLYFDELAKLSGLPEDEGINKRVQDGILRVLAYQSSSGSFGLWAPGSESLWLDAYVTDFLTRAREQKFDVPEEALVQALQNLQNRIAYDNDIRTRGNEIAYALYVLSRSRKASLSDLRYYADTMLPDFPTPLSKAHLAAALSLYGDSERANAVFLDAAGMSEQARLTPVSFSRSDYGSALRDAAGVLALAAESRPVPPVVPILAKVVADEWKSRQTLSTQEQTWMLLAARALQQDDEELTLEVNGTGKRGAYAATIPGDALLQTPLTLTNTGLDPVSAAITTVAAPVLPPAAGGEGFEITKTYYSLTGEEANITEVIQNERYVVVLEVTKGDDWPAQLLVSDLLPAGFEIDNPSLVDSAALANFEWIGQTETAHLEFRSDRFVAAISRGEGENGTMTLAYVVRAVTPGTYDLPAASVEDMYRPQLSARTAAGAMTVSTAP